MTTRRTTKTSPGMTLIELMVALGIAFIFISAAMSVFAAVTQRNNEISRRTDRESDTALASMLIQRDLMNAGFRFPSAQFAVVTLDNVTGATVVSNGDATAEHVSTGPTDPGIVQGTDIVEVLVGSNTRTRGALSNAGGTGTATPSAILQDNEPFLAGGETPAGGVVVLMAGVVGTNTVACIARTPGSAGVAPITLTTTILGRNLRPSGAGVPNCPQASFSVHRLGQRVRYMIMNDTTINRTGLFVQRGTESGAMGTPEALVWGIEDLQVSPIVLNDAGNTLGCGAGAVCRCNRGTGCTLAANPALDTGLNWSSQQVGLQLALAARGDRTADEYRGARPALYNHAAGAIDGLARSVRFTTIWFRNLTMVAP